MKAVRRHLPFDAEAFLLLAPHPALYDHSILAINYHVLKSGLEPAYLMTAIGFVNKVVLPPVHDRRT